MEFWALRNLACSTTKPRSTKNSARSTAVFVPTSLTQFSPPHMRSNGKMDEAKTALAEARRLNPKLTVKWLIARGTKDPMRLEVYRKAGLPEE